VHLGTYYQIRPDKKQISSFMNLFMPFLNLHFSDSEEAKKDHQKKQRAPKNRLADRTKAQQQQISKKSRRSLHHSAAAIAAGTEQQFLSLASLRPSLWPLLGGEVA
jgi:hypothetical protein